MLEGAAEFLAGTLTPAELRAGVHLAAFVLVVTELLKRLWRRFGSRYQDKDVWFISTATGVFGAFHLWPASSQIASWIAGLVVSGLVSFAHKHAIALVEWKFPDLARILTGERRRQDRFIPDGQDRRRNVD